jgi:uncharacterized repeat protein (TIGR01451 family)
VSWTIQVCNDGICPFGTVTVLDTLDAGLTYVSDDKGSVQGANAQIRSWTFSNLNPGQCVSISLTAKVNAPCAAAVLKNNVGVEAVEPASPCNAIAEAASAHASAQVNCSQPDVSIQKSVSPSPINPGQETTVTLTIANTGGSALNPINVCDKLDAGVSFNAGQAIGGNCGVTLSSNTPNADGTRTICFSPFSLALGASCTISYKVGCVTSGAHPDTATVVALCSGSQEGAITKRAASSFNCACIPDVEILKSVAPPSVIPGEDVTVTLTVSNPGGTTLNPINVCDKLDAGTSFDAVQVIGGTCGVTLLSNTLNGDGTRTICFSAFSLAPQGQCTIIYKVRCVTPGTHPDTATVVARCQGGSETDVDRDQAASSFTCLGGGSCPRTVGYWSAQCAQKGNGSTKFSKDKVIAIAECVDASVQIFSWAGGTASFDGFCATITPSKPMDCKKQALRQFAGLLANSCVGSLGFKASNGDSVFLNLSDPNPCTSSFPGASTLGDLIHAIDNALVQLKNENADAQDQRYCAIVECADGINNGRGIPIATGCAEGVAAPSRGVSGSDLDVDAGSGTIQPGTIELYRPQPNPFQNTTEIAYAVGGSGENVQIGIYDVAGRQVRGLVHEFRPAGTYRVMWNGADDGGRSVAHGVYFLRAYVGGQRVAEAASRILYLR